MRTWPAYRTLWVFLLLGWTVSAADRALTGPVITWMIENDVAFLKGAENPYALGGLIGGLFFAGYMLTQFPGGYLGDKYGHRTIIVISLIWAGIATMISGVITGLVAFIAVRVITGLGEGAFYSNDRSLIAQETPQEKRSLGMGFVITGLSIGITIAVVFTPNLIALGSSVFAADQAWRMPFLVLGAATLVVGSATALYFRRQERGLPFARATLHLMAFSAVGLAAVMGVYFIGDAAGLSDLWIAVLEVGARADARRLRLHAPQQRRRRGAEIARPRADQHRVHRGAVEPVVLQLLVGLDRRRRRRLELRPQRDDRRLQRRRRHPRLPGRRLAVRRRRAAPGSAASRC